jgi:hypothetical protein
MTENQILGPDLLLQKQATARDRNGRFAKGRSGNPAGRSRGIRNPRARQIARLCGGYPFVPTRGAIDRALDGHRLALLLCLEWIIPPRRSRPILLDLPPIRDAADLAPAIAAIIAAAAQGEITTGEALDLSRRAEKRARAFAAGQYGTPASYRPDAVPGKASRP